MFGDDLFKYHMNNLLHPRRQLLISFFPLVQVRHSISPFQMIALLAFLVLIFPPLSGYAYWLTTELQTLSQSHNHEIPKSLHPNFDTALASILPRDEERVVISPRQKLAQRYVPVFEDITSSSGISTQKRSKYGGPIIADLDNDGNYDLILTYHKDEPMEIYYGSGHGKFIKSPHKEGGDIHGVSVAPRTATSSDKLIVLSLGAGNGKKPRLPRFLLSKSSRSISSGIFKTQLELEAKDFYFSRGRITMFMDLAMDTIANRRSRMGGPDILVASFLGTGAQPGRISKQYALRNKKGNFTFQNTPGFQNEIQGRAELTDVDGDGRMEIISYQEFRIYKLVAPFKLADVTSEVAPNINIMDYTVMAAVDFDMDNDGDFDLYLARGFEKLASNSYPPGKRIVFPDILLENRGGKYYDVTDGSNIVGNTFSSGVSAEDLNNDGYVDLIVTQSKGPDIVLLNRGDGTFDHVDPRIPKPAGTRSDNTVAVDMNGDGFVDLVTSQGLRSDPKGLYVIMKNVMPRKSNTNFLLVRVGNSPSESSTALHAVVSVMVAGRKMVRRVGNRGAQKAGPGSYMDIVHFGLGASPLVQTVKVRWVSGETVSRRNVRANLKVELGSF